MRNFVCFAAVVAMSLTCPTPGMAQLSVQNADGTITITAPTLAPPLTDAVAAEAAAQSVQDDAVTADRLTLRQRRKLGFTRLDAIRAATKLARAGQLPSTKGLAGEDLAAAREEIKEAIAAEIMGNNIQAWATTVADGDVADGNRDWTAFFQALLDFLEQFMPILLQILNLFGGFAQDAALTPTVTVADLVPVAGPQVMILAP